MQSTDGKIAQKFNKLQDYREIPEFMTEKNIKHHQQMKSDYAQLICFETKIELRLMNRAIW